MIKNIGDNSLKEVEVKNPFFEVRGVKGERKDYSDIDSNYVVFMISGSVKITGANNESAVMESKHMYALCKLCAPYQTEALEDFHCLVLMADSLANHVSAKNLMDILSRDEKICKGLPGLRYNIVFDSFINSIILLEGCSQSLPVDLYNVKKVEYLHYMRQLYSKDELAKFLYGIVSTYSDFKMKVYENYDNSVTVDRLAERMFMTTRTFTRHFNKEFDTNPLDWLIQQRVYNLNYSIVNKAMPLSQILEEFNFNTYSLLKQFCKRNGIEHLLNFIQEEKAV